MIISHFEPCRTCNRFSWVRETDEGKVCNECGSRLCNECGAVLSPMERKVCSLCTSSTEHAGDLGW